MRISRNSDEEISRRELLASVVQVAVFIAIVPVLRRVDAWPWHTALGALMGVSFVYLFFLIALSQWKQVETQGWTRLLANALKVALPVALPVGALLWLSGRWPAWTWFAIGVAVLAFLAAGRLRTARE